MLRPDTFALTALLALLTAIGPLSVDLYLPALPEIGRAFGGKHHTTVIHSINKIEKERHTEAELNRLLHSLMDSLQ